ncbi:hypothetical protein ACWKSP_22415 [Micromonosporaceae bacterium Da 78-11]
MNDITPIETRYAGCRFRSRIEARTAVWLDHLHIEWLYEPDGFSVGPAGRRRRYLPDFYLPQRGTWIEVKGHDQAVDFGLMADAASPTHGLPLALGLPLTWPLLHTRMVMVGPLPSEPRFHQSLAVVDGTTVAGQLSVLTCDHADPDHAHHFAGFGGLTRVEMNDEGVPSWSPKKPLETWGYGFSCPAIESAYVAARSARFEHGQSG